MPDLRVTKHVVKSCLKKVDHVEIPDGATGIAAKAFYRVRMRTISIPDGLRIVGPEAFRECINLEEVVFPFSLERLGAYAFADCGSLRRVVFPDTLKELPFDAFAGCERLERVEFSPDHPDWKQEGNLLCRRGGSAFLFLPGVPGRTCRVPDGMKAVPPYAFKGSFLTEITLPASVEMVGEGAMMDCQSLTSLRLSAGLRIIEKNALAGCWELKKLVLPDTLEALGDCALDATDVREMVLPASLRTLGANVFRHTDLRRLVMLGELPEGMKALSLNNLGILYTNGFDFQADHIPMVKFSRATQEIVLRNFLRRRRAGEPIPEETKKDRLDCIRRRQKELRVYPVYQNILLEERLVGPKDIDSFLEDALKWENPELSARLLDYQEKYIDREEKARLEEKKLKKELRALTRSEPTLQELKRLWPGRLLENGSW